MRSGLAENFAQMRPPRIVTDAHAPDGFRQGDPFRQMHGQGRFPPRKPKQLLELRRQGRDVSWGDSGKDRFDFNAISESKPGSSNRDQINDLKRSQDDKIDLSNIDANTKNGGNQKFNFIGDKKFSKTPGELRFDNKIVQGDVNGDGKADFEIRVDVNKLSSGDFIL